MRTGSCSRAIAANDPNARVAQRPQLGDRSVRVWRRKHDQSKRRYRQGLIDDVVQVFVAEGIARRDENTLLAHDPRLEFPEEVRIWRTKRRVLLRRRRIDQHLVRGRWRPALLDRKQAMIVLGPRDRKSVG